MYTIDRRPNYVWNKTEFMQLFLIVHVTTAYGISNMCAILMHGI